MYTQSPPLSDAEIDIFLNKAKLARFCTMNKDGTIHAAPVWFLHENGEIIIATPEASRKARNVRHNPNVTVLVDESGTPEDPAKGVIVYGEATIVGEADPKWGISLFEKYVPKDKAESTMKRVLKVSKWMKIVVTPIKRASFDYGKDVTWREAMSGYAN
ncbi:MAG: pyridoxamine 5'-phosphate oxidase family protein [Candidatus Hodarchaeota archaeon]